MQPDDAMIDRLMHAVIRREKNPHIIARIAILRCPVRRQEFQLRIRRLQKPRNLLAHRAVYLAAMLLLEFPRIREPGHDIPQRANREFDQHILARQLQIMRIDELPVPEQLHMKVHVVFLRARHDDPRRVRVIENRARILIHEPHMIVPLGNRHAHPIVKIQL